MNRITDTLQEEVLTVMTIFGSIILRLRNVSEIFVANIKTHILCSIIPPPPKIVTFVISGKIL